MSDIQTQIVEAAKWRGVTAPMLMDAMQLTNWSYALRLITGRQDMRISTLEKLAAVLGYEVQLVRKQSRGWATSGRLDAHCKGERGMSSTQTDHTLRMEQALDKMWEIATSLDGDASQIALLRALETIADIASDFDAADRVAPQTPASERATLQDIEETLKAGGSVTIQQTGFSEEELRVTNSEGV